MVVGGHVHNFEIRAVSIRRKFLAAGAMFHTSAPYIYKVIERAGNLVSREGFSGANVMD